GKISKISRIGMLKKVVRRFPDKDLYIRLEDTDIRGEKVFVIHSLYPDQDVNLIELFFTIDLVKENGGVPYLVVPYLAYSRQDKEFQKGEAFSLKTVGKILKSLGLKRIITVDAHFHRKTGDFDFFGTKGRNVSAVTLQIEHAKKVIGEGFIVVGPDTGSKDFLAEVGGAVFLEKEKYCPVCGLPATECKCKERVKEYVTKTIVPQGLKGKDILLIDDMVTSGSTIIEAAKALHAHGNKVSVSCTHGLFLGDSLPTLKKYAERVFATDTVKSEASEISVAHLLAEEIKKNA
ncbi:MAG: ribose-phosphate pyrophosphokinase, partial [Thermoplasmata archaeon]|nr:ribose-phosphate pyrophosphokinase [Thermoplasmata archaeon]